MLSARLVVGEVPGNVATTFIDPLVRVNAPSPAQCWPPKNASEDTSEDKTKLKSLRHVPEALVLVTELVY
jgi:hypothetical protein